MDRDVHSLPSVESAKKKPEKQMTANDMNLAKSYNMLLSLSYHPRKGCKVRTSGRE